MVHKKNHDWEETDPSLKNTSFRIKHKTKKYYLNVEYEGNNRRNRNINLKKGYVDIFNKEVPRNK